MTPRRAAAVALAVASLVPGAAGAAGFDFDETFRHWGDSDHMGIRGIAGVTAVRVLEPGGDAVAAGVTGELWGQGAAYWYGEGVPKTFRFMAFGGLGALAGPEGPSFDGRVGGEAMFGVRLVVDGDPDDDPKRAWPRTELVARAGFAFRVEGNPLFDRRALEAPRLEIGVRQESFSGVELEDGRPRRQSYVLELRAVVAVVAAGSVQLGPRDVTYAGAPAWGAQLDLVGVRPEINATWLRTITGRAGPYDSLDTRACLKVGPKVWSRHPYIACVQGWLAYELDADTSSDIAAAALRAAVSFGVTD